MVTTLQGTARSHGYLVISLTVFHSLKVKHVYFTITHLTAGHSKTLVSSLLSHLPSLLSSYHLSCFL